MKQRSRIIKWLTISGSALLVIAITTGIWIPYYIKKEVNDRLQYIPGYSVMYSDMDIAIWKGAYTIHKLQLRKTASDIPVPFFTVEKISFSINWNSIFRNKPVSAVSLESPAINFVRGPSDSTSQTNPDDAWITVLQNITPFQINNFSIQHGAIWFRDFHSFPKIELLIDSITLSGNNLVNLEEKESTLPATIAGRGKVYDGNIVLHLRLNPLQQQPLFDMDAQLKSVSLIHLADFLKIYHNVTVTQGTIDIQHFSKVTMSTVRGSFKTILRNASVEQYNAENKKTWSDDSLFKLASWKSPAVNPASDLILIEGEVLGYSGNMWSLIGETLTYTFNRSIKSALEEPAKLKSQAVKRNVPKTNKLQSKESEKKKGFFEKIFGKKDDKEKKSRN